jgi:hypothetical protein
MEFPAVGCARCGRDWLSLRTRVSPGDNTRPHFELGQAYALVTGVLVLIIFTSGWCWSYLNVNDSSEQLHSACLVIWAVAGGLLALSQLVFIVVAVRTTMSSARVPILLVAAVMLTMIILFVFALAQMPS